MKNVFYFSHINEIGGVETFFYNIAKKYEDRDITVFYKTGDPDQVARLRKHIDVRRLQENQTIRCERFFTNYNIDILDRVEADQIAQIIHADYKAQRLTPQTDPRIDRYLAVSRTARESFEELTGIKAELCYNPFVPDAPVRMRRLVSATRMTPEKGRERIEKLADAMDAAGLLFTWEVYTTTGEAFNNRHVIAMKPELDIAPRIAAADFLVQLSDSEAFCYTVVEALAAGTPVIVTDLPVYDELGLDETNSIRLDLEMESIPIRRIAAWTGRVEGYKPPPDLWDQLLTRDPTTYDEPVKVQAIVPFLDLQEETERKPGDEWSVSKSRASFLEERMLIRRTGRERKA